MAGSLDGIRVIDMTTIYSGPIAAAILADQGADVVKVEAPPAGDAMRAPFRHARNGLNGSFAQMNRNKRSIVIDLATEPGKDALRRLVAGADVLMENFRPGVMERLGVRLRSAQGHQSPLGVRLHQRRGAQRPLRRTARL